MNKIIISKLNNDENKIEWRISNSETGHYLNISISRALEDAMKKSVIYPLTALNLNKLTICLT